MTSTQEHRVKLGRTGLDVCRIGIGGGCGISDADLEYAISRGVNYVFSSTDLHASMYRSSWETIRRVAGRGSRRRDEIVLVGCSYVNDPEKIVGIVVDHMHAWNIDHLDVFQWGWVTPQNENPHLIDATQRFLSSDEGRAIADAVAGVAREVQDELRCRGYARHLGVSTHDRALAVRLAQNERVGIAMVRYNIAHRGVEREFFAELPAARPGVVVYNAGHTAAGSLTNLPAGLKYAPTQRDLYRFVLDSPFVDVVLTGPKDRDEIDEALRTLDEPPLHPSVRAYLEKYGDVFSGRKVVAASPWTDLPL